MSKNHIMHTLCLPDQFKKSFFIMENPDAPIIISYLYNKITNSASSQREERQYYKLLTVA